jgi:hypothetical protein
VGTRESLAFHTIASSVEMRFIGFGGSGHRSCSGRNFETYLVAPGDRMISCWKHARSRMTLRNMSGLGFLSSAFCIRLQTSTETLFISELCNRLY